MDHIWEKLESYFPIYLDEFLNEHIKGNHARLIDNPVYPELKLLIDSINLYREYLDLPKLKLSSEVKTGLERRKA